MLINYYNNFRPASYIQNRINWCWAAVAKIVGFQYKIMNPQYNFKIVSNNNSEMSCKGFVSTLDYYYGVKTKILDGLRIEYIKRYNENYLIDPWQRAIVMNANTQYYQGYEGNVAESDEGKINALKYVVTGDINSFLIQVNSIGLYSDPLSLMVSNCDNLAYVSKKGLYFIGNYIIKETECAHSVAIMPNVRSNAVIFDPWDGFCKEFSYRQLFETGFYTNLGHGVIKWIQYIL